MVRAAASVTAADWNSCVLSPMLLPEYDWYGYAGSRRVLLPMVTRASEVNFEAELLCSMMLNALLVSSAIVSARIVGCCAVAKQCQFERTLSPLLVIIGIIETVLETRYQRLSVRQLCYVRLACGPLAGMIKIQVGVLLINQAFEQSLHTL